MGANATQPDEGKLIKVANFQTGAVLRSTTLTPFDDTIPQITEGSEFMSLAYTPKKIIHNLHIRVVFFFTLNQVKDCIVHLHRNGVADALAVGIFRPEHADIFRCIAFSCDIEPIGTIDEVTFSVRAGTAPAAASELTMNGVDNVRKMGGRMASSLKIWELKP